MANNNKRKFVIKGRYKRTLQNGIELVPTSETDDPIKAHQCLEWGCDVFDKATGKSAFAAEEPPGEESPVDPAQTAPAGDAGSAQ